MADLASLAPAAALERDRRRDAYPTRVQSGTIDVEAATVDFQCWVAIAEWLETGRFFSFFGGADPARSDAPYICWPELETAAASALASITAKADRLEGTGNSDNGRELAANHRRRAELVCIHRAVQLRRATIDQANAEIRARRPTAEIAA